MGFGLNEFLILGWFDLEWFLILDWFDLEWFADRVVDNALKCILIICLCGRYLLITMLNLYN